MARGKQEPEVKASEQATTKAPEETKAPEGESELDMLRRENAALKESLAGPMTSAVAAPAVIGTSSGTKVLVANHHTAPILFPRSAAVGVNIDPIVLAPGSVTSIDSDEWTARKRNKTVQYYLDHGIITETERMVAQVSVTEVTTANAPIPANLQTAEEQKAEASNPEGAPITASVVRSDITQQPVE